MSPRGGGWFTAAHQANNSNKPVLARRGAGDTILKRRFKALQINKKENMNLFPFRSFLSCPESLTEDRRGEDRLTKYFSDANLVNSVGCVWQTAPALHISSIRNSCLVPAWPAITTIPATRISCQAQTNLLWNYLQPFLWCISWRDPGITSLASQQRYSSGLQTFI